jgi:YVTN family beta-propeller protein
MRRTGILLIVAVLAAGSAWTRSRGAASGRSAGSADLAGLLSSYAPDHRRLTPAGTLYPTKGSFPAGLVIGRGGRTVFVADASKFVDMIETFSTAAPAASSAAVPLSSLDPLPGELPNVQSGELFVAPDGTVYGAGGQTGAVRAFTSTSPAAEAAAYQVGHVNPLEGTGDRSGYIGNVVALDDGQELIASEPFSASGGKGDTVVRYDMATKTVTGTATVGNHPFALAVGHAASGAQIVAVANQDSSSVSILDPVTMTVKRTVVTGRQPDAMAFTPDGSELLVVDSLDDEIVVLRTRNWSVAARVSVESPNGPGAEPNSLALSADGRRAYVTLGADNAVAVIARNDRGDGWSLRGLIPTARYPTGVAVDGARHELFVTAGKAGAATIADMPANLGALERIPIPDASQLALYTAQVRANDEVAPPRCAAAPLAGIKHVIFIIRENKTYDAEFGDMPDGDPAYLMYGRASTPNSHALADRYVLFEDFDDDEEVSDTGHQVMMGGVANDWVQRQSEQSYNLGGAERPGAELGNDDDVLRAPNGYLFNAALAHHISFLDYGEFYERDQTTDAAVSPALGSHIVYDFPGFGFDPSVPDTERAAYWIKQFDQQVTDRSFPQLEVIYLPEDHTTTVDDGAPPAQGQVADNDLATGQIVDALSHSPYWQSSVVFLSEDDPQDGMDHIDPHRSISLLIGPHVREGVETAVPYDQLSILRTIEMILHLPPLTEHDATARPMLSLFDPRHVDDTPYDALTPDPPLATPSTVAAVHALSVKDFGAHPTAADEFDSHSTEEFKLQWLATHGKPFRATSAVPGPVASEVKSAARRRLLEQGAAQAAAADDCPAPGA